MNLSIKAGEVTFIKGEFDEDTLAFKEYGGSNVMYEIKFSSSVRQQLKEIFKEQ